MASWKGHEFAKEDTFMLEVSLHLVNIGIDS